jgi:hypothetical protein
LILSGVVWLIIFYFVPALKYPAKPPGVGGPETIYRKSLYIAFLAISGFSALGLAFLYRKLGNT